MSLERRADVRTRRGALFAAFVAWIALGFFPIAMLIGPGFRAGGVWAGLLVASFLAYPAVLFALGYAWSSRWKTRDHAVRADEQGLWIDGKLAWRRRAIRHARLDEAGDLHLRGRFGAASVALGADGPAWLAAMRLEPERSVARYAMQHGSRGRALIYAGLQLVGYVASFGLLVLGAGVMASLAFFATLIFAVVSAARIPTRVEVGADGVRFVRSLARGRFVPFGALEGVAIVGQNVRFVLRSGETIIVHHNVPRTTRFAIVTAPDEQRSLVERVAAQIERHRDAVASGDAFARGGRTTEAWLDDLGRVAEPAMFRTPATPPDVLWRVVEDATASTTARAGAAFALRSSLDDEGRARLRVLADACAAPKLRVALDGVARDDADLSATFDALADDDAPAPRRAALRA